MGYCTQCGHHFGHFEKYYKLKTGTDVCAGCYEKMKKAAEEEATEKAVKAALAPYLNDALPTVNVTDAIMRKDEVAHAVIGAKLFETKTVNLGYSGASHGVSIPLPIKVGGFPVRYRVGQSRGHLVKKDELMQTSSGQLLVTNRVFLNPVAGSKPVSVELKKIASFHVYEDALEVWQEGHEHPYLFGMDMLHGEICGLCLNKLLGVK
jgi:hypothetical protein